MDTAYIVVAAVTAAANLAAAVPDFVRAKWILDNMSAYGVPHSWIRPLGVAKAAGALGLLAGIAYPTLAVITAVCLVAYFVLAVITVARARVWADVPYPALFLGLAIGCLVLAG